MTSFPPAALTQSPPRELRPPWDDYPSAHPLEIHRPRDDQLPPIRADAIAPSRAPASAGTATSPQGPHHAKPHRSFLASDRARYVPHPLACEPPCPAGSAPASTGPPAQPAVPPPWGRYLPPADWLRQPAALKIDRSRDGQLPPELADANAPPACKPPCPAGSAPAPTDPPAQPAVPPPWGRYLPPADWLRQPAALKIDRSRDGQLPPSSLTQSPPRLRSSVPRRCSSHRPPILPAPPATQPPWPPNLPAPQLGSAALRRPAPLACSP